MKLTSAFILILISLSSFCQTYNFKPKWKVGEVKKISFKLEEREYLGEKLISDETTFNEATITVLNEDAKSYTIEYLMENQVYTKVAELYDKLDKSLTESEDLRLVFSIDKQTAEHNLLNWNEAKEFIKGSYAQILKVVDEEDAELASTIRLALAPIVRMFNSKENIEAYMKPYLEFLLIPFNKDFKLGETISITEMGENPLNPAQDVSTTSHFTLKTVDESSNICKVDYKVELDLSEFTEMMKTMLKKMLEVMEGSNKKTEKKLKEIDSMEINFENEQLISFNKETTWVERAVGNWEVSGVDPKDNKPKRNVQVTTIVVR